MQKSLRKTQKISLLNLVSLFSLYILCLNQLIKVKFRDLIRYDYHWAVHAPSIVQAAPLTCLALSLTKKAVSSPTSSTELNFPDGCFYSTNFFEACSFVRLSLLAMISICFWIKGVKTQPGQMAFEVIPCLAYSRAVALVNPIIPCLEAT